MLEAQARDGGHGIGVAFSFLGEDEPMARALADKLEGVRTFVFTERQEELLRSA